MMRTSNAQGRIFLASNEEADQRKSDVEHLFDRQRPKNAPAGRTPAPSTLQPIHVKGERRKQALSQTRSRRIHFGAWNAQEVQNAEHSQNQEQARQDACHSHAIEARYGNARQFSPPPNRQAGDEEPGNHKERNDGVQARPEQHSVQRLRKHVVDGVLTQSKSQMTMVQDHRKYAESTQYIDTGEARLTWYCGFLFE